MILAGQPSVYFGPRRNDVGSQGDVNEPAPVIILAILIPMLERSTTVANDRTDLFQHGTSD